MGGLRWTCKVYDTRWYLWNSFIVTHWQTPTLLLPFYDVFVMLPPLNQRIFTELTKVLPLRTFRSPLYFKSPILPWQLIFFLLQGLLSSWYPEGTEWGRHSCRHHRWHLHRFLHGGFVRWGEKPQPSEGPGLWVGHGVLTMNKNWNALLNKQMSMELLQKCSKLCLLSTRYTKYYFFWGWIGTN